ncbi:phosphopantetheine-binding protein [Streptoalloteichus hindustanus]|uniref:Aryl carrier domain-containing protein n=1 Tax=Streptoalloteichus hindustanus TaxID=2017 RepID=A0A1M5QEP3_STRHI|nr:phosphopantetheine-binding protein [Streptoalloteichus hindustanus]SHH12219.1 Aryl carrier domain-containing protein [Streptoalloteichus hindustanus]
MPDQTMTLDSVRADLAEVLYLEPADIAVDDELVDTGLDSVRIMSLVERWRAAGVEVTFVELAERPSLAAWWELLSTRLPR